MKRIPVLLLCVTMLISMLCGCSMMSGMSQSNALSGTNDVTPGETRAYTPLFPEDTQPPRQIGLSVLMEGSAEQSVGYVLTAVNPYGEFATVDVTINAAGAEALTRWLLHPDNLQKIEAFGTERYEDSLFYASEAAPAYTGWISPATEATETVRLMTTWQLKQSGLLEDLLEAFAEEYGYKVEMLALEEDTGYANAVLGKADLFLLEAPEAGDPFAEGSFYRQIPGFARHIPLFYCPYVLCGPTDDPAGTEKCADFSEAFGAIARKESLFISRGDQSPDHKLEQSLWPADVETADSWYFSVDTAMGPCVTIADEMGGYVLCDKLTWTIYLAHGGII